MTNLHKSCFTLSVQCDYKQSGLELCNSSGNIHVFLIVTSQIPNFHL